MNITLPDSLASFINEQVRLGRYPSADALVADIVGIEASIAKKIGEGELPTDEDFNRRLAAMLDEADESGDYQEADAADFDAMEREAMVILAQRS